MKFKIGDFITNAKNPKKGAKIIGTRSRRGRHREYVVDVPGQGTRYYSVDSIDKLCILGEDSRTPMQVLNSLGDLIKHRSEQMFTYEGNPHAHSYQEVCTHEGTMREYNSGWTHERFCEKCGHREMIK